MQYLYNMPTISIKSDLDDPGYRTGRYAVLGPKIDWKFRWNGRIEEVVGIGDDADAHGRIEGWSRGVME